MHLHLVPLLNTRKQQVGIISDEGSVYLSGLNPKEKLSVFGMMKYSAI